MKYIDPNITFVQEPMYKVVVRKLNGVWEENSVNN